jgi:hypothetical protein
VIVQKPMTDIIRQFGQVTWTYDYHPQHLGKL